MPNATTLIQLFSLFSIASLQKPYLPFLKDVVLYVAMSGLLLFLFTLVLVFGVADPEMHVYLTKATRDLVPQSLAASTTKNEVAIPMSYEVFTAASVTMSVVATLALLLCASFMVQLASDGMTACVAPMVALTLQTVKPQCWDGAEDLRGKVPPSSQANS